MSAAPAEAAVRVVIIDDTDDLRDLLRFALVRAGMNVVAEAGDGAAGIDAVRRERPDVVLLDLSMPVMDGMTALPRIRALVPDARIIVFSGFGASQLSARALAGGADDYLQKGSSPSTVLTRIREVLARPRPGAAPAELATGISDELFAVLAQAPYGAVLVGPDRPHPLRWANGLAGELLGETAGPTSELDPVLAEVIATRRLRRDGPAELTIDGRRCLVTVRDVGRNLCLYVMPCPAEVDVVRSAVAATAHELRGPVTVLAAVAETISTAVADGELEETHLLSMTASIARQARILDGITADLLTTAQVQRGTLTIATEAVDPREIIDAAITDRRIDLATMEIADDRLVRADPRRLEQMLTNLLGNAHKHGRAPVFVRVRASVEDRDQVCIDVEDSGSGVAPDFRDQLFREFTRGDTSAPGTGLGLHVVRTLALAQGGTVSYASAPGGGAVFTISLPSA
jgi:signal transduction histidine kinase/CheY-like chemotaxis protein